MVWRGGRVGCGAPDHGRNHVDSALSGTFFHPFLPFLPRLFVRIGWMRRKLLLPPARGIEPGGDGRSIERNGRTFTGEKLRRRDGVLIRWWGGLVVVAVIVGRGGRWLIFTGQDHLAGSSDERIGGDVIKDQDDLTVYISEQS